MRHDNNKNNDVECNLCWEIKPLNKEEGIEFKRKKQSETPKKTHNKKTFINIERRLNIITTSKSDYVS